MNDFDKETTCSFTGHRILKKDFSEEKLYCFIENIIKKGYKTFLSGMAIGFDTECFECLIKLKEKYNIDVIACVPCKNQAEKFNIKDREKYYYLLKKADKIIILYNEYNEKCMSERNKYMVDNSSLLIAYLYVSKGGTYSTVKYALKKGKKVEYFCS